ncbi:TPA: hypothetical protein HH705_004868 [Escherichia coli]|nr:hypothetical protein [Escherichia coli]
MNYDEITKITAERISDYMTEAVNTDSIAVAEMFHNAAWGVRTLWFELVTKIDMDMHKKSKRLVRTVLIFTESSDQLSRATDRVPGLPASPGYVQ